MSVLKVGALQSPSSSSNNIVLNSDGTISTSDGGTFVSNNYISGAFVSNNYYEAFKLQGPTITSIHPSTGVYDGLTVYIDGSGFDPKSRVILYGNNGVEFEAFAANNVSVNSSANITFTFKSTSGMRVGDHSPFDVVVENLTTGLKSIDENSFEAPYLNAFLGFTSGYAAAGSGDSNVIEKFSFTSDGNATDVGDLGAAYQSRSGQSSKENGYVADGWPNTTNILYRYPFATDSNATNLGVAFNPANYGYSVGHSSSTHGYQSGGTRGSPADSLLNKFSFSNESIKSVDYGDLTLRRMQHAGVSGITHAYAAGGDPGGFSGTPAISNIIDKFSFSVDSNATDVGDLVAEKGATVGQSSVTHGYSSGSDGNAPTRQNSIDKWPFASDSNATDVGDITTNRGDGAGSSSFASGYTAGGGGQNVIDKFPFATDSNATDVGDCTISASSRAGGQK